MPRLPLPCLMSWSLLLSLPATVAHAGKPAAKAPPGFSVTSLDPKTAPCNDFFQYACGGWMSQNPIPADRSRWGRFDELAERNLTTLHEILEQASTAKKRHPDEQRLGDFYAACMNEAEINKQGLAPIAPLLARITALTNKDELPVLVAELHRHGIGVLFGFGSEADMKNSKATIAGTDQGGLGLPDRDYYFRDDAEAKKLREDYRAHVAAILRLAEAPSGEAEAQAIAIMQLETRLAKASLDLVTRRDPNKIYHKLALTDLQKLNPSFAWPRYLEAMKTPAFKELNVAVPDFVTGLELTLKETSLGDLKSYLTWHVVSHAAPLLPVPFVNAHFDFYGKTLTGAKELKPRWKRCVDFTDEALGEALGKLYVERTFGKDGKARMVTLVQGLERALKRDIQTLDWMTEPTKMLALQKLAAIANLAIRTRSGTTAPSRCDAKRR